MSVEVMSSVWKGAPYSGSDLITLLALADWCNDEGGSLFPSIARIADKARISESQARRILRKLESDGLLSVVGNALGGRPGSTRQYQLNVGRIHQLALEAKTAGSIKKIVRTDATRPAEETGCMDAQEGLHGCADTGVTHASLSVSKPSHNHQQPTTVPAAPADPDGFADCWSAYPKRAGSNSRASAVKAYRARLHDGALPTDLLAGVKRYAAFVRVTGKEGSEYVKQAATFFGPGLHFLEPWALPAAGVQGSGKFSAQAFVSQGGAPVPAPSNGDVIEGEGRYVD